MLSICDNADVLATMRIIKICIQVIKIIVPILLMISIAISYTKAIAGKDEEVIKKTHKASVTKAIAAVAIFLIPTFVGIVAKATSNDLDYMKCISNASSEGIDDASYIEARLLVEQAERTLTQADYTVARMAVEKLKDSTRKNNLTIRLNTVAKKIEAKSKEAAKRGENPGTGGGSGGSGGGGGTTTPTTPGETGTPINIASSFGTYAGSGSIPKFSLYIPKNASTNMPLVVFMPANDYGRTELVRIFNSTKLQLPQAFLFIPTINWSGSWQRDLENQINKIVNTYSINSNRISITGFSTGGWYMYIFTSAHQNMFAAILPISVGHNYSSPTIQQNLNYYRTIPMKGYGESIGRTKPDGTQCGGWPAGWIASTQMSNLFNGLGRGSDFTNVGAICHDKIFDYVFNLDTNHDNKIDVLEWAISQSR